MTELRPEPGAPARPPIRVRAMGFQFDASIPRWWFFGSPVPTHFANGLNLLFPDGERFFIRSVKHYLDEVDGDPELAARIKAFFGQEGRHGHEHERFNRILEAHGYDVETFLAWYRHTAFEVLERRVPPHVRLAATAALEHYTATMAENALRGTLLENADPRMRELLRWHAAEEIEHKSVAFEVLQRVDPRWSTRALGMALGSFGLFFFWAASVRELLRQEAARGTDVARHREEAERHPRLIEETKHRREMLRKAVFDYLRPDFHPDQTDNYELAREYLSGIGRLDG